MARSNPIYHIAPSAIGITPNANNSANDLAVFVAGGCKIKVYSPRAGINYSGGVAQEWTLTGRNRRLMEADKPYTIYARLPKEDKTRGYLVFAPKDKRGDRWNDRYCYVTTEGLFPQYNDSSHPEGASTLDYVNWWIRLGDVSAIEDGQRTISFDTGILGTEEFNAEWALNPDAMPLRVELGCTVDDEDAGPTPYVFWGKSALLSASLVEGWTGTTSERFDHWEIARDTGNVVADAEWNAVDRSQTFGQTGRITLQHARQGVDDFGGAVSTIFAVRAMGRPEGAAAGSAATEVLAVGSIAILAETLEKYELVLSTSVVSWNPGTDSYSPADGVVVNIRAIDQRGDVVKITKEQFDNAGLHVSYQHADTQSWTTLPFNNPQSSVAEAVIPIAAFEAHKNVNIHIMNAANMEMHFMTIAFLRDGEDSREREWIFQRFATPVTYGDAESDHPLPSLVEYGEVEPGDHVAGHVTNEKNQDGWVPEGWWDEMHGTDDTYHYEYGAYRDYIREDAAQGTPARWGDFTKPTLWSYSAEDAVSYRCRWTLDDVEIWQLTAAYTGAFRGTLPLIATLMRRKGSDAEQAVTTDAIITVNFDGLEDQTHTFTAQQPRFVISEEEHPEFIPLLNDVALTGITITFATGGEEFVYTIPVIREADEESIIHTMEQYGSEVFLSKKHDDTAEGHITFMKGLRSLADVLIEGVLTAFSAVIDTIQSSNYTGDGLADTGFRLTKDDGTGSSKLTVDNLHVRKRATFEEVEVKKETAIAGNQVYSIAANVIDRTDYYAENGDLLGYTERRVPWLLKKMPFLLRHKFFGRLRYMRVKMNASDANRIKRVRCYFLATDGDRDVDNMWETGDLARCQTFNLYRSNRYTYIGAISTPTLGNVYWWRKVIYPSAADKQAGGGYRPREIDGAMYHYFDVYCDYEAEQQGTFVNADGGSMIPCAGDHVVQFGNDSNADRMNLIVLEVNSSDAPAEKFYEGIHNFNLNDCYFGGSSTLKTRLSPRSGYKFHGPKFEVVTEYAVAPVPIERGAWVQGTVYYYYDIVQHNGASWLCVASTGNVYTVSEDIVRNGTTIYTKGASLNQSQYNGLQIQEKMLCFRSSTGSTTVEPGNSTPEQIAAWRIYAEKGEKGDNMVRLDLSNEMDSLQTDSTGKVLSARSISTVVHLYDGATEKALTGFTTSNVVVKDAAGSIVTLPPTITDDGNGKRLTWSFNADTNISDRYDIVVSYNYNNLTYSCDFAITATKGQAIYQLKPSMSAIPFSRNANGEFIDASKNLSLKVVKIDGMSTAEHDPPVTGLTIRYSFSQMPTATDMGDAWPANNTLSVANSRENVYIALFNFYGKMIDRETVPVVKDGARGASITKRSEVSYYIKNTTGVRPAENDPNWNTTKPTLNKGEWLFTKIVITWSDTSKTVLYTDERNPNDGAAGQDIIVDGATVMKYYVGDSNTTHPADTSSEWKDLSQVTQTQGKWLWSQAKTNYKKATDGSSAGSTYNYNVSYIAKDGQTGRAVKSMTEYYKATNSSSAMSKPTSHSGWDSDPNLSHLTDKWDASHKYLWNMEEVVYTESNGSETTEYTIPQVLAIFTQDGNPGKGIDSIQNKYKVTSTNQAPAREHEGGTGWSNNPVTPGQGQYLWNYEVITWINPSGTTYTDVQMIGYCGTNGTSPYFADIDNEMDSVACDPQGNTTTAYDAYIGVHVWHGSTEETLTKLQTNSITGFTITPDAANKRIHVQVASGTQIEKVNTIAITTASANSGDKTLHFVLNGVRAGAKGEPATLYTLVPNVSSVAKKKDGSYSVNNVSCTRQKNVGGTITDNTTDGEIKYKLDGGSEQSYTNNTNIAVTNFTKSIQFIFRVGGVIVDTESIPMVADGDKGDKPIAGTDYPIPSNGSDAYSVIIEPSDMLFTQSTDKIGDTYPLVEATKTATITVKKGNSNDAVAHSTSVTSSSGCQSATASGDTIIVVGEIGNYTEGSVNIQVAITNGPTFNLKLNLYYNLLGTWKQSVEGGVSQVVADTVTYNFINNRLESVTHKSYQQTASAAEEFSQWASDYQTASGESVNLLNTRISDAEGNISKVERKIPNPDLFNSTAWIVNTKVGGENKSADYDSQNARFYDASHSVNDIYSPIVALSAGKYTFSGFVPNDRTFDEYGSSIALCSGFTDPEESYITIPADSVGVVSGETKVINGATYHRCFATFTLSSAANCSINLWGNASEGQVAYPKLEKGSDPTYMSIDSASYIKQTADEIDLGIRNDLGTTGINIKGNNHTIDLIAGKVNFKASDGTSANPYMSIDSSGKLTVDSIVATNGQFTGQITATSGYITGEMVVGSKTGNHISLLPPSGSTGNSALLIKEGDTLKGEINYNTFGSVSQPSISFYNGNDYSQMYYGGLNLYSSNGITELDAGHVVLRGILSTERRLLTVNMSGSNGVIISIQKYNSGEQTLLGHAFPTSSSGLSKGTLYVDNGYLKVVT